MELAPHPSPLPQGAREQDCASFCSLSRPAGEGRGEGIADYRDMPGFCKSATLKEIESHGFVLTPGRYVGSEEVEEDDEAFAEKMERFTAELNEQFIKSHELEAKIKANLEKIQW